MRRLLFVTPTVPRLDAAEGGSRAMAQLITRLGDRHRVGVVCFRKSDEAGVGDLERLCDPVLEIEKPEPSTPLMRWSRRLRLLQGLAGSTPLWAGRLAVSGAHRRIEGLADAWKPHVVQFEYHVMGQYASALDRHHIPRVLVQHEPGTAAAREAIAQAHGMRRTLAVLDRRAWERYERRVTNDVDCVVAFTAHDCEALRSVAGETPTIRIPLGTEVPAKPSSPRGTEPLVLFIGTFRHQPNVDAAVRLYTAIMPMVRARVPEARLAVVGERPPRALLSGPSWLAVPGRVPETRSWLDRAAVVVAPLRLGGGMRVKVLEGLAAGKALVCSHLAVEGLAVEDGRQVRLADSDTQLADAIVDLLRDADVRERLGQEARRWACDHAGWDHPVRAYERLYDVMVGPDPARPGDRADIRARVRQLSDNAPWFA